MYPFLLLFQKVLLIHKFGDKGCLRYNGCTKSVIAPNLSWKYGSKLQVARDIPTIQMNTKLIINLEFLNFLNMLSIYQVTGIFGVLLYTNQQDRII